MARSSFGKADRFYKNPVRRDEEWNEATQAPWWLVLLAIVIVVVAFFAGVYAEQPYNALGWIVGIVTIAIYGWLGAMRKRRARVYLRKLHGQT